MSIKANKSDAVPEDKKGIQSGLQQSDEDDEGEFLSIRSI